jgi:hypothetical protein
MDAEQLQAIAEHADEELKKKYKGNAPSKHQILKLKLRGRTPHSKKAELFDSADYSLRLKNTVLAPPNYSTEVIGKESEENSNGEKK